MQTIGTGLPAQPGAAGFGQLRQPAAGFGQLGLGGARGLAAQPRPLQGGLPGALPGALPGQPVQPAQPVQNFAAFQQEQAQRRLAEQQAAQAQAQAQARLQAQAAGRVLPVGQAKPAAGCEGRTFEYVLGFAIAAFLLAMVLGILFEFWISGTNCITRSMFGSLVFYSFIAALLVALTTFIAHRVYCQG